MRLAEKPIRRCMPMARSAILSPRCPRSTKRASPRIVDVVLRRFVVSRATKTRPSDATEELFDTLSAVAAVDVDDDDDARPAVAFACSTSSPSPSSSPPSSKGRGLFARRELAAGDVALRVPGSVCLVVDYSRSGGGLSLPTAADGGGGDHPKDSGSGNNGNWPRTRAAVSRDPETPWDFLLALALLDAVSGDGGGSWWQSFADGVLPQPSIGGGADDEDDEEDKGDYEGDEGDDEDGDAPPPSYVTLPLCLPRALLSLAGHRDLELAAAEQQRRLAELYPSLAAPASSDGDSPTMMQWSLACVRSRSFSLVAGGSGKSGRESGSGSGSGKSGRESGSGSGSGKSGRESGSGSGSGIEEEELAFAFVPLLDCANHAGDPNAAFRPVWKQETEEREEEGGRISSSTTRRRKLDAVELVALRAIAPGDEVLVSYTSSGGATNRRMMAQYGFVPTGGNAADRVEFDLGRASSESGLPVDAKLDLDRLQDLLGPQVSSDIMRGKNLYLFAAIKSLPLASGGSGGGDGSDDASTFPSPSRQQTHNTPLARALLAQVEEQLLEVEEAASASSSLFRTEDVGKKDDADDAALAAKAERRWPGSALASVLRYRAERGALLRAARAALRLYCAADS